MRSLLCIAISLYLLQLVFGQEEPKNSRWVWKRPNYAMPWLKGPNVCAVEEVVGSRKRYYSECHTYMPRRICEKPTFIRYHCCTGFERLAEDAKGCLGVVPVVNLMDTAKHLYLKEFRKAAQTSGVEDTLTEDGGTFTVFAPHNKAFREADQDVRDRMSDRDLSKNLLRYHITPERYYLHELKNDMTLPSMSDGSPIKINRYANGIVTANCARIMLPNQIATNGVLHVTEEVMEPIAEQGTVMEILLRDDRFGELVTALIVTQLGNKLRDEDGHLTVFAPTDAAFRNAPRDVVERILNNKDILEKLLKYHILDNSICSAAILGKSQVTTLEGQKVNLTCDVDDKLRVNDIPVSVTDIVGTNGVIHVIDEILVPDSAKSLREVLLELDLHEFIEYAQQAGVSDILNAKADGNYTIFVPAAEAFRKLTSEERRLLQTNPGAVEKVFKYMFVPGRMDTANLVGGSALPTLSDDGKLRIEVHQRGFSVNGANIILSNNEASNGIVHVVDKILMPAEGTAVDKIKASNDLSTFMSTLQTSGLDGLLLDVTGNYTIFAPTNEAFDALESSYLERLMLDSEQLTKFLRYHILKVPIYTRVLKPELSYRYKTLTGEWLHMRQKDHGEPIIINESTKIVGEDLQAGNGVIYHINEVLRSPSLESSGDNLI